MPPWLSALAAGVWGWIQNHPVSWVQRHPVWSTVLVFLVAFGKKVWAKLEPKLVDFDAESLAHRVAMLITGYGKLYAKHLYYKRRTFNVKGFSSQANSLSNS